MGVTAILIIRSSMGKRSGAHFNPAITLTYLRLGKIYSAGRFLLRALPVHRRCRRGWGVGDLHGTGTRQPVRHVRRNRAGKYGTGAAFAAETFMAALLMGIVLWTSNRPSLASYTSYLVGILITFYVLLFAPVSGFSINPARTTGSAVFAEVWTAIWIYFTAPVFGMLFSAEVYLRWQGQDRILCAKLHPDPAYECPFLCQYPGHHPATVKKQIR